MTWSPVGMVPVALKVSIATLARPMVARSRSSNRQSTGICGGCRWLDDDDTAAGEGDFDVVPLICGTLGAGGLDCHPAEHGTLYCLRGWSGG